jgi:predicted O-methyltransferase YrrM
MTQSNQEQWNAVDEYISSQLVPSDAALDAATAASAAAGLPSIAVAPNQGKLLGLLVQSLGARRVLEVGTLGGYSSIWLARALQPGGQLITLELEPKHAEVARKNLARAGVAERVDVRVGRAVDTLQQLIAAKPEPFDFIFIDADKASLPEYFRLSLELSRVGTVILIDNVVRKGAVVDPNTTDANVIGVRRLNERIAAERRVNATAIQTVGSKGYDGFAYVLVTSA